MKKGIDFLKHLFDIPKLEMQHYSLNTHLEYSGFCLGFSELIKGWI